MLQRSGSWGEAIPDVPIAAAATTVQCFQPMIYVETYFHYTYSEVKQVFGQQLNLISDCFWDEKQCTSVTN